MLTFLKWLLVGLAAVVALVITAAWLKPLPGERTTPAGIERNLSVYVPAADGTLVAVDVWLPETLAAGAVIPTVIEGTRYWRASATTLLGRVIGLFGEAPGAAPGSFAHFFNARGYAYATVDVRGTGASFGVHASEYSEQEVADYAQVLDWIVAQSWSDGNVAAIGVSYGGTSAELMTTTGHPALKAVAPLYSDFDAQYQLTMPGGVYQPAFTTTWGRMVDAMDRNDICTLAQLSEGNVVEGVACVLLRWVAGGVKPVDADLLDAAVAEHDTPDVARMVRSLTYRDSTWGPEKLSMGTNQAYARQADIEASGVPMFVVAGWFDAATVDGAIARFASFSNPQTVILGPFDHGGGNDTDPYNSDDAAPVISRVEMLDRAERFFAEHLSPERVSGSRKYQLTYYPMGGGTWRRTSVWPPAGLDPVRFYLNAGAALSTHAADVDSMDSYQVDYSVGTASTSRWMTQMGGRDVIYDRRAQMSERSLVYTSDPLPGDVEITGTVTAELWMASDREDGALHVYLENVTPDGRVHYLSEGVLRLLHRAEAVDGPYAAFGFRRSYLERDAAPMPVGEPQRVAVNLFTTSAVVRAGHRLRFVIAGADSASFQRLPESGEAPVWSVFSGPAYPSVVTVPIKPWLLAAP
ncbi:MAG: CocE/NonD family hydrolase [Pseudomonadales bacterium]|jgi:hypothetical protein|nr:CocE/NonD family hydrolase [Pseudomonadales bacterium]MDP6470469.1 CocE/NonD family hydrolase [Pseudomonadales bacterium]MDP6827771.1 CocE/NonD family hydrolase [Pseudomonadales bacterium]MDP6973413.1 CocE/NonD family hydrolase [Pseudomonadales bacterium]